MKDNRLTLGTVQFGLNYGVNNFLGKPKIEDSIKVLQLAYKNTITSFDTAFSYGDAEEILGVFIKQNKLAGKVKVISKLRPNVFDEGTVEKDKYKIIKWEVEKTLKKLNISCLDGYLLHTPAYIYDGEVVSALKKLKKNGLIKNFGVSIYDEAEAFYAVEKAGVDYIQIPYNVFDQRLDRSNFFELARLKKIKVFARSAFLQGLMVMDQKNIPKYLPQAKQYLKTFKKIISKYGYTSSRASLLFSLSHPDIDQVVIGVDNSNQLKEDLKFAQDIEGFGPCRDELKREFLNLKDSIIFPSLWAKKK